MHYVDLTFELKGTVAIMTMNRPQVLNALSPEMFVSLERAYQEINRNHDIRVAILTGAGRGFCSGIDLKTVNVGERARQEINLDPTDYWIAKLLAVTKPTIAAVNGVAVGGGMALTLACDIRIASDQARFSTRFAAIGAPALDGTGSLLPRAVGLSRALELIYTADMVDAERAERVGLVSSVVPHEQLLERSMELAERIAAGPPLAHQLSKYIVYNSLHRSFPDHMPFQQYSNLANATLAGHDLEEGALSFRERREPRFRGLSSAGEK